MPELPDVEAMRLTIEPDVVGRTFVGVTLNWPRAVRHPSPGEFNFAPMTPEKQAVFRHVWHVYRNVGDPEVPAEAAPKSLQTILVAPRLLAARARNSPLPSAETLSHCLSIGA